jgi:dTMP kinase
MGAYYESGGLVADRQVHYLQRRASGLKAASGKKAEFYTWLYDFEFSKWACRFPTPLFILNQPRGRRGALRRREAETGSRADIHERDSMHLAQSLASADEAASVFGWKVIDCMEGGAIRSVESIHAEVAGLFDCLYKP